jgi:hypothetical protein
MGVASGDEAKIRAVQQQSAGAMEIAMQSASLKTPDNMLGL